jgi:hypothetical protein
MCPLASILFGYAENPEPTNRTLLRCSCGTEHA